MLLSSIVSIRKDSRTEMQAWRRGTELLPKLPGWRVGEDPTICPKRRAPSVPDFVEGLSSGWPLGSWGVHLDMDHPTKVRIKPAGRDAQASDYTSIHIRLLSQD